MPKYKYVDGVKYRVVPQSVLGYALVREGSDNSLPAGGTDGQVLAKASDADYDVEWSTVESGGMLGLDFEPVVNPPEDFPVYAQYGVVDKPIEEVYRLMTENFVYLKSVVSVGGTGGVLYIPLFTASSRNNITQIMGSMVATNGNVVVVQSAESIPYDNKTYFGLNSISLNLS